MQMTITLSRPHKNQAKVLSEKKRFNVLNCGRRWGKSKLAVNLLSESALTGNPVGYFTPTYKLLEGTFAECHVALSSVVKRKHENQRIELITGGVIEFWSLDNPLAGRSRKYATAIIDEASFCKNLWQSWTEAIRPTLTDLKGDAWFLSTPRGKNDFYKLHRRGIAGEPNWASWTMPTSSNPYIDNNEIEDARRDLPELAFRQEYMAEFSENIANPFGTEFIDRNIKELSKLPAVCYGVDLAKSFDWTVVIGLDKNGQVCVFERWQSDWSQTKQRISNIVKQVPTAIDSTGVGDAVVEDLQRTLKKVEGFKFTSTSKQQLMEGLAVAIQQSKISYIKGMITEELHSFEYEYTNSGVRYSAPQGLHDDCVCALALAWSKFNRKSNIWVI